MLMLRFYVIVYTPITMTPIIMTPIATKRKMNNTHHHDNQIRFHCTYLVVNIVPRRRRLAEG